MSEATDQTLPALLLRNARDNADAVALRQKELGIWRAISWADFADRVARFALGLEHLGFGSDDIVAILADNRPQWLIAELAAQGLGGKSLGIYQDSVAEEVHYLLEFAQVRFVVAEDQEQVDKILDLRAEGHLANLAAVIYFDPKGMRTYSDPLLRRFDQVESLADQALEDAASHDKSETIAEAYAKRVEALDGSTVAVLSTTSGTTGKPKLAMLTHRNLLFMSSTMQSVDPMQPGDNFVSLLPLAWIGEQMTGVARALSVGFSVNFPEEPETVSTDLREIGPQTLFSPPRIWENMLSEIQVKREDTTRLKRWLFDRCLAVGYAVADQQSASQETSRLTLGLKLKGALAEWACFFWLRDQLGLRRMRHAYTGGAALGPDVFRFFHAIGVNLKQIYGQTEVSGISVAHRDGEIKYHTVGRPLPGTEIKLSDDGEIRTRSDAVFAGYYLNPEATEETLVDGWLLSGDAGDFDQDGHLVVIDRVQDVMTLKDGARFSPQFLENKLKFSPYVQEAVVFGGGEYPFVTGMITIDFGNAGKWAERHQLAYTTFTDLAQKDEIYQLVKEHIKSTNAELPDSARIARFLLLHKELDADDAELTRTRKVRRGFVAERYADILRGLYSDEESWPVTNEIVYQDGSTVNQKTNLRIETLISPKDL